MGTPHLPSVETTVSPGIRMKSLLLLSLVCFAAGQDVPRKIRDQMAQWNFQERCWGYETMTQISLAMFKAQEYCNTLAPQHMDHSTMTKPFFATSSQFRRPIRPVAKRNDNVELVKGLLKLLNRNKRQAEEIDTGLLNPTEEDFMEFVEDMKDWKTGLAMKISNLTCVMTQLQMIDDQGKPNMQQYTEGWWEGVDTSNEHIAASDPEWKEMMINSYMDCNDIAQSWPQESLDRNPLTKKFGRNMIFFRCAKKSENLNCGKWQILKGLEVWYGKASEEDRQRMTAIGLPANKYDAAVVSMMVLYDAATPEEEFVNDFFWGKGGM